MVLAAIVFWLLPLWGIVVPLWGFTLLILALGVYEFVTFRLGWRALARRPIAAPRDIVGCCGKATTKLAPDGYVQVNGELWHALSVDTNIPKGDAVVVVELKRLTLHVAPLSGTALAVSVESDIKI